MKTEEKMAEKYLMALGYTNLVYEPKGNRTPDFAIGNEIAVEVRRLNQHFNGNPLEKLAYSLIPKIEKQLENFGNNQHQQSAFVGIYFSRPLKYTQKIQHKIDEILKIQSKTMHLTKEYTVNDHLRIKIFPSQERLPNQFNFGASLDYNQGGFVLHNILESLKIIIPKKYKIIKPFKSEYRFWWLVLIDFIGYGLEDYEINDLKKSIDFDLKFDKVLIISGGNPLIAHAL